MEKQLILKPDFHIWVKCRKASLSRHTVGTWRQTDGSPSHLGDKSCHDIVDVICGSTVDFTAVLELKSTGRNMSNLRGFVPTWHSLRATTCVYHFQRLLESLFAWQEGVWAAGHCFTRCLHVEISQQSINKREGRCKMNSLSQLVWTMPLSLLSYFFFPTAAVLKSPSLVFLLLMLACKPVTGVLNKASFHWLWFGIQRITVILTD